MMSNSFPAHFPWLSTPALDHCSYNGIVLLKYSRAVQVYIQNILQSLNIKKWLYRNSYNLVNFKQTKSKLINFKSS